MTKVVVLVRHGKAEARGTGADVDRKLTSAGASALAAAFPRTFSLVEAHPEGGLELWTSPAVRARQTSDEVARALGADPSLAAGHTSLLEQDEASFREELSACQAHTVVAVGHVPFMDEVCRDLCGVPLTFATGGVAAIELAAPGERFGRLLWFVQGPRS